MGGVENHLLYAKLFQTPSSQRSMQSEKKKSVVNCCHKTPVYARFSVLCFDRSFKDKF
jgi:hypothetical protein